MISSSGCILVVAVEVTVSDDPMGVVVYGVVVEWGVVEAADLGFGDVYYGGVERNIGK